jgi:glutathione S-transferase
MAAALQETGLDTNGLTLWGTGTSRILRVHWMLAEMGLEYQFYPVHPRSGITDSQEFRRINPRHKVPVLRHGETVITQSAAIVQYIAEAFDAPAHVFIPRSAADRARINEWCFFCMTELDAHSLYVIRRHKALAHVYGEAPEACRAASDYFNDQLASISPDFDASPCLFGERISCADILLGTCLDWAKSYEFALPGNIAAYHDHLKQRPAYQAAVKRTYLENTCASDLISVAAS